MRIHAMLVALAVVVATPAAAEDYPKLKSGQWDIVTTTTNGGTEPHKTTLCMDDSIQKQMMDLSKGMQREMCSKSDLRREGSSYISDSVCQMGESKMVAHSVMTIQGDTGYKTVISTTYDPPLMGVKDSHATLDGKFVGPCRDGLQPGDVVMPDGRKFNMKAVQGQVPAMPPAKAK